MAGSEELDLSTSTVAKHITVRGIVQGVNFRYLTRRQARALNVTGWVRNCSDGSVEVVAQASMAQVQALIQWMSQGPSSARVDGIEVEDADPHECHSFDIR